MQRQALLVAAATALVAIMLAWFARERLWRRPPLIVIMVALAVGLLFLFRRIGWGEILVVAVVVLVPMLLVPARK
jgi:FtsH-binding integral membrane protein